MPQSLQDFLNYFPEKNLSFERVCSQVLSSHFFHFYEDEPSGPINYAALDKAIKEENQEGIDQHVTKVLSKALNDIQGTIDWMLDNNKMRNTVGGSHVITLLCIALVTAIKSQDMTSFREDLKAENATVESDKEAYNCLVCSVLETLFKLSTVNE